MKPRELLAWGIIGVLVVSLVTCAEASARKSARHDVEKAALLDTLTGARSERDAMRGQLATATALVNRLDNASKEAAARLLVEKRRSAQFLGVIERHTREANARPDSAVVSVDTVRQWLADAKDEADAEHRVRLQAEALAAAETARADSLTGLLRAGFKRDSVHLAADDARDRRLAVFVKASEARCRLAFLLPCPSRTVMAVGGVAVGAIGVLILTR